jgi:hypothetical protein
VLLALALGIPAVLAARRARIELVGVAALATDIYFVAHAAVDWIWTFPAVGVLAFVLLGIGASSARPGSTRRGPRTVLAAGAVLVLAIVAFLPPWLASRYDERAAEGGVGAAGDLRWARRLDPLSTKPYVTEAGLASTPAAAVAPLVKAVRKEPRSYALHYLLGVAYLRANRSSDARPELELALRLNPKDPYVRRALEELRRG